MVTTNWPKPTPKQPEYTFLAISVDQYDATTDAGINLELHGSTRYLIRAFPDTQAFPDTHVLSSSTTCHSHFGSSR